MTRYALLRHECPAAYRDGPHWDFLAERPGVDDEARLACWSLLRLPEAWLGPARAPSPAVPEWPSNDEVAATPLADHRAAYLEYEGPLSGARGDIRRVARGRVEWLRATREEVRLRLIDGERAGVATFRLVGEAWRLDVAGLPSTGAH